MKELEVRKDYINIHVNDWIIIDRLGDDKSRGFYKGAYSNNLFCNSTEEWREATKLEVIEAFKKYLVRRYGEDWETMKIKEKHPSSTRSININSKSYKVEIAKFYDGWNVWNENGLLYCEGIWVERLKEEPKIHIQDAIKANTAIHCETEDEAERILEMAHELGYKWNNGESFKVLNRWGKYKNKTCYCLFNGSYSDYNSIKNVIYNIIPSTKIADLEPPKLTGWSLSPEDIKEIKADEKVDKRYALKRDVLTILSVESKLNPDKKLSEYLEQFKLILEVL